MLLCLHSDEANGVAERLTLMAVLDEGQLKYLQWHEQGCASCHGVEGAVCVHVGQGEHTCGSTPTACSALAEADTAEAVVEEGRHCELSVYLAWAGTDRHRQPLMSGAQVRQPWHVSVVFPRDSAAGGRQQVIHPAACS